MAKMGDLPERVVRFYGNPDYALDAIAHRSISFIHATKLNDPFDPYFFFESDFDFKYDLMFDYVKKHHPNSLAAFKDLVPTDDWEQSVAKVKTYLDNMKKSTFVFSCSAVLNKLHPIDNLYMWGHYGNGHRGIAIEFDTVKISENILTVHVDNKKIKLSPEQAWIQIEYKKDAPLITKRILFDFFMDGLRGDEERSDLANYFSQTARIKSYVWKKENEWRMLWSNDETRQKIHRVTVPEGSIYAVYVGLVASDTVADDIVFETSQKFPTAKIYRARKKPGFSGLDFEEIRA